MTTPTGPDKPLIFNWGDGSPETPAAYGEVLEHTYASPGDYLITVREAGTGRTAHATFDVGANPSEAVLTIQDATVKTCEISPFEATLTNGFGEVQQVYSVTTLKAAGVTALNTVYQRQRGTAETVDTLYTIPLTDMPDGSVRAIYGPFQINRDADTIINFAIKLPQGVTGPVTGTASYVSGAVYDPNSGDTDLNVMVTDAFTLTVQAGDCSSPPVPAPCTVTSIAPAPNVPVFDDSGAQTGTEPQQITVAQGISITGTALNGDIAMIVIDDANNGFPATMIDVADDGTTAQATLGLFPVVGTAHFKQVLVQDANNTARCSIDVDWVYTPGPIPEPGAAA